MIFRACRPTKHWLKTTHCVNSCVVGGIGSYFLQWPPVNTDATPNTKTYFPVIGNPFVSPPIDNAGGASWNTEIRRFFQDGSPTPPTSWQARDVLIASNVAVYALWKMLSSTGRGEMFFFRHFVGAAENIRRWRFHSLVLSGT